MISFRNVFIHEIVNLLNMLCLFLLPIGYFSSFAFLVNRALEQRADCQQALSRTWWRVSEAVDIARAFNALSKRISRLAAQLVVRHF